MLGLIEMDSSLLNRLDSEEHTPLSLAILQEKFFSSKSLLAHGASVNIVNFE
jgi:hypothetical protein